MKADSAYDVKDLLESLQEFRGSVFSIGGDAGALTLPNFLAHYNSKRQTPVGASMGTSPPLDAIKWRDHIVQPHDEASAQLNAAQSMAKIDNDVQQQVDWLTTQLKTTFANKVDMANDWKMLTVLIGANNACPACRPGRSDASGAFYGKKLDEMLTAIHEQIPRTFVNVVTMFNISQVATVPMNTQQKLYRDVMWGSVCHEECPCMTAGNATTRHDMDLHSVAYKNLQDFAVVIQPFTENMLINDINYLSKLDTFHPSLLANEGFAVGLWNNLFQKQADKTRALSVKDAKVFCPTENDVFQTN